MNAVLSGEINSYRRVDAETVEIEHLRVLPHSVLHLTSPKVVMNMRPGGLLRIEGTVLAVPGWSPRAIFVRAKGWVGRLLASF